MFSSPKKMATECLTYTIWAWVFGVLLFLDGLTFFSRPFDGLTFQPLQRLMQRAGRFLFIAVLFGVFVITTQTSAPETEKKC